MNSKMHKIFYFNVHLCYRPAYQYQIGALYQFAVMLLIKMTKVCLLNIDRKYRKIKN